MPTSGKKGRTLRINSSELRRWIERARRKFSVPAIAITLMTSTEIHCTEWQGTRVAGGSESVSRDDLFHIGSCSKSVLALLAGKLVDTGKLQWDTLFFGVFPELREAARPDYHSISLEQLFLCRAGIAAYDSDREALPSIPADIADRRYAFMRYLIGRVPATAKRSDGSFPFLYSNAGYTMIACMLERVSGLPYESAVKHMLTDDLGLGVYFGFPNTLSAQQPWGHLVNSKTVRVYPPDDEYKMDHLLVPAGDISMTMRDFARYIQLQLRGLCGQGTHLKSETLRHIHFGHKEFSLGVANGKLSGHTFSGMDGSAGTFFCRAILVPEADFAFTIMMNAGSGTGIMPAVDWLSMKIARKQFRLWWKFCL